MAEQQNLTLQVAVNSLVALLCWATMLPAQAQTETETLRGSAIAVDGRIVSMDGKELILADIIVPEPGAKCLLRGKLRDCGKFARLGLTELVVAATIECRKTKQPTYNCRTEDGYDLALGQIHAGWAVPTKSAPAHYFTKMNEAKTKKRMLWSALHADGKPGYASALLDRN
ncbi:hypothetical protein [Anderseniella sp. Alg231-50]|uniref:hypothetical protein n=1 Tax=Anderseniella sp. Alg231-50 TaxID=1922226 RepID=UPI000D5572EE